MVAHTAGDTAPRTPHRPYLPKGIGGAAVGIVLFEQLGGAPADLTTPEGREDTLNSIATLSGKPREAVDVHAARLIRLIQKERRAYQ